MALTRLQPRQHASTVWRQWERFTVAGIRVNNKRYSPIQAFFAWFLVLVTLYVMRWIAMKRIKHENLDDQNSKQFWQGRHLIFCISPGRSGSKHLRNVLDAAEHVRSFHEPQPAMTGNVLQTVLMQGLRSQSFKDRSNMKLSAIRNEVEGTLPSVAYAETSHMFVKTFSDVVLQNLGDIANISIIVLHRPLAQVLYSQLRLGWFAPGHSGYLVWYYDVQDLHESERKYSTDMNLTTALDRLIGYNADVIQRREELRQEVDRMHGQGRWKNVQIVDVNLSDISSSNSVTQFLNKLGLRADQKRIQLLSAQDDNDRELKKDRTGIDISLADVSRRLEDLQKKLPPFTRDK